MYIIVGLLDQMVLIVLLLFLSYSIKYVVESQYMTTFTKILQNTYIVVYSAIHVITLYKLANET